MNYYINDPSYGTGYVMWFLRSPQDTDTISMRYIPFPDQLATAGATSKIPQQFGELQYLGLVKRAIRKKFVVGIVPERVVAYYEEKFEEQMRRFEKYLKDKTPGKLSKVKTARQAFGMYNSGYYTQKRRIYSIYR